MTCSYTGQAQRSAQLKWTEEVNKAYFLLKKDEQTAPALPTPDYIFHLYVTEKQGYACAVLMHDSPTGKQPMAYYSTKQQHRRRLATLLPGIGCCCLCLQKGVRFNYGPSCNIIYITSTTHYAKQPTFCVDSSQKNWL